MPLAAFFAANGVDLLICKPVTTVHSKYYKPSDRSNASQALQGIDNKQSGRKTGAYINVHDEFLYLDSVKSEHKKVRRACVDNK